MYPNDKELSKNFTVGEFIASSVADGENINNSFRETQHYEYAKALCENVLEKICDKFGPISLTSGYRVKELNKKVCGAKNSQHIYGEAADFTVPNNNYEEVIDWIKNNLTFHQLIHYLPDSEGGERLHISYRSWDVRENEKKFVEINGT